MFPFIKKVESSNFKKVILDQIQKLMNEGNIEEAEFLYKKYFLEKKN